MDVFTTPRLRVRQATVADEALYLALWTDPRVMRYVGFPQGLRITPAEIHMLLAEQQDAPIWGSRLLVSLRETGTPIGECNMHLPNEAGISTTDVKLLPDYWGQRYGVEIKRALVSYLFAHTDCLAVEATPNVKNVASIKMQEAVGGVRIGERIHEFPPEMQSYTTPVHSYVYHVRRPIGIQSGNSE